jgi:stage II sporulation protein R
VKSIYEIVRPNSNPRNRARRKPASGRLGQVCLAALVLLVAFVAWSGWRLRAEQAYNLHNLVRLHVVANSDQPADQEVKLEVRDAILGASEDLFAAKAPDDAIGLVKANLPLFQRVAENVLVANGYDYTVGTEFGTFSFPERAYGPLVLPAGDYQALRIVLGEGKGANWWCILFPPLCYLDVVGGSRQTQWGVTSDGALTSGTDGASGAGATTSPAPNGAPAGKTTRAISVDSLTPQQALDLQGILEKALANVKSKGGQTAGAGWSATGSSGTTASVVADKDSGVRIIVSEIPASPDSDLVILVADTGSNRTEVRFYVFDRLRELIRSLAVSAPWLVQGPSGSGQHAIPPER